MLKHYSIHRLALMVKFGCWQIVICWCYGFMFVCFVMLSLRSISLCISKILHLVQDDGMCSRRLSCWACEASRCVFVRSFTSFRMTVICSYWWIYWVSRRLSCWACEASRYVFPRFFTSFRMTVMLSLRSILQYIHLSSRDAIYHYF